MMPARPDWLLSSTQFEWTKRRRTIYAVLVFCAVVILYLMVFGADTQLNRDIAGGAFLLAGTTLATWVGGTVWDDGNARKAAVDTAPSTTIVATTVGGTTTTSTTSEPSEMPR